jgi:hypothetical protein
MATLTVRVHGGSQTSLAVDHDLSVNINGTHIGNIAFDGTVAASESFEFDAASLRDSDQPYQ